MLHLFSFVILVLTTNLCVGQNQSINKETIITDSRSPSGSRMSTRSKLTLLKCPVNLKALNCVDSNINIYLNICITVNV